MEDVASLEARHRKEKKELQSQVQALKKAAKNDKTKKKEIAEEITKLENDLDSRHKKEIDNLGNKINNDSNIVASESHEQPLETSKTKISKAQKRRDKKSQQDKERNEQIKLQEKENKNGPRNIETQTIIAKLKEKSLDVFPIPSDGDCLYKAVLHQLMITDRTATSVEDLRKRVAEYIKEHRDDFIPFMSNSETFEMLTPDEFEDYCEKIISTKVWGGQLEIRALSNILKCPIKVIQASGPDSIDQGVEYDGQPLVITYHRHMYSLGEHYNSTLPCLPSNSAEDEIA